MKTMRKEELDKAAWNWVDTTDPKSVTQSHVELAYRINLDVCRPNSCRRNCRGNPRCLSGLGESKWLGPKAVSPEEALGVDFVDPDEERRTAGSFVGLKNLGATCYVNSLLQLWFHNIQFRHAIYSWSPEEDPQEKNNDSLNEDDYTPVSSIGHLQLLFALLQFGKRNSVDPTSFILSLGLDTTQQQDAQEFSKLFISMLEERLSHQSSPLVKNIIHQQFCGKYSYVTKCQQCGTESDRPSLFYELELNIAGHKTLADSLEEFLRQEKLEGADRYHCTVCKSKQDATRNIKLDTLPPVLNLQLMRFVFDRQKGCKKKLHSYLQFPENLDMSLYLEKPAGSLLYVLSAVLIHTGISAYSGHYVAHICDSTTSTWYKFNDETVEKMEGKKLKLGSDEDIDDGNKKNKPQRVPKGYLMSNNAYMLVYTEANQAEQCSNSEKKNNESGDKENWILPQRLKNLVAREDQKFEDWVREINETKAVTVESSKAKQQEMINMYNILRISDGDSFEFINSDWLVKWLTAEDIKPIDNSSIVCLHGKLDPAFVPQTKCISSSAADLLYEKYGGGPRLNSNDSMCLPCVKHGCQVRRIKAKTAEDSKKVSSLLKFKLDSSEPSYWIGKNSLKCWRKLVLQELEGVKGIDTIEDYNEHNEVESSEGISGSQRKEDSIETKVESSDISSDVKISENASHRLTRSKSKIVCSSGTKNTHISNTPHCNETGPSCDSSINSDKVSSHTKEVEREEETVETEISSTVFSENCQMELNENDVVSSSDDVLRTLHSSENIPSENGNEVLHIDSSSKININALKTKLWNKTNNIALNGASKKCNENTENGLEHKPKYIRIKTPGFCDDIILDEICEKVEINSSVDSESTVNRGQKRKLEVEDKHEEVVSGVCSSEELRNQEESSFECRQREKQEETRDDDDEEEEEGFNEDILCVHENIEVEKEFVAFMDTTHFLSKRLIFLPFAEEVGSVHESYNLLLNFQLSSRPHQLNLGELCVEEGLRRLVSKQVWDILKVYFPSARTFSEDAEPCNLCQNLATEGRATRDLYRQTAVLQKEKLLDLYFDRNRITFSCLPSIQKQKQPQDQVFHLVSREFINSWRRFIKDPGRRVPETCIVNSNLLCPHSGLLYDPENSEENGSSNKFVVVNDVEWNTLNSFYSSDYDINVRRDSSTNTLLCEPAICEDCVMARLKVEEMELLQYEKAKIFVRKVARTDNNNGQIQEGGNGNTSTQAESKDDPEYQGSEAKRPKIASGCCSSPTPGGSSGAGDTKVRKSTRHRRMRGEREIIVSSKLTLLEFKVMVMKLFHVAPFDQHLSIDGRDLTDNNATLGSLQVYPDSIIILKADEPTDDPSMMDDALHMSATFEEGFKGTELLK